MRVRVFTIYALLVAAIPAMAQTSYDAIKVMGEDLNGTARYVAMGGAMGAFGSDISVISKNPAGIGTFVQSDANITLSFSGSENKLMNGGKLGWVDNVSSDAAKSSTDMKVAVNNASFVMVFPAYNCGSLKSVNVGFSYHRTRDYDRMLLRNDDFKDKNGAVVFRDFSDTQRNRVNSFDFNISFNHYDCVYWGLTVGAYNSYYNSTGYFYDYYPSGQLGYKEPVDYTSVDRAFTMNGYGWNLKTGVIVRPMAGGLRAGLSISTPTFYRLSAAYTDYLYARGGEKLDGTIFNRDADFHLTTPWTLNASLGYSSGRSAIGMEYEYNISNSTSMSISSQQILTQCADIHYKPYSVIRVGYETNISKISLRCGYNYTFSRFWDDSRKYLGIRNKYTNEFIGDTNLNGDRSDFEFENIHDAHTATAGIGYCSAPSANGSQVYVDAAYMLNIQNSDFSMGEYDDEPFAKYRTLTHKVFVTFGVSF